MDYKENKFKLQKKHGQNQLFNAGLNLCLLYSIMLLMKEIFSKIGQRLFTPPIWTDQDKTLAARQVFSIVRAFLLSATFLQLVQIVIAPVFSVRWLLLLLATFAVSLLLLEIARRGHVTSAAFMLVVSLWLLITIFSWTASGFGARAAWGYFIVVFIAGMLLGRRIGILTAGLCSAATLFIGVTSPIRSPDPIRFWLINTLYLAIVLLLQNLASRSIRESLQTARQQLQERQQAEAALVQSERKHREMVNSLPFCVFEMDLSGRITFVNQTTLEWFGYSEAEFLAGMNVFQILVHPDDGRAKENLGRLLSGRDLTYREYQVQRKDGSTFTGLIRSRLLEEDGQPVAVQGSLIDVSERKQAEKEKEQIISLQRATIESTADGILVIDHLGRITDFNQRFARMWSIPDTVLAMRDDAQAMHFVLEQLLDPQGFVAKVQELYEAPDQESFDLLRFKDGRCFERYSRPQVISGQPVGRVWSFRDISERKRAEEALLESEEKYRQTMNVAPIGIYIIQDLKFKFVNPEMARLHGYEPEEMIDSLSPPDALVVPEHREMVRRTLLNRQWGSAVNLMRSRPSARMVRYSMPWSGGRAFFTTASRHP
jgi:PAS domain S-box-containing protein